MKKPAFLLNFENVEFGTVDYYYKIQIVDTVNSIGEVWRRVYIRYLK